ncbi:MAG: peptidoglycan editing factor PgeF [Proteobacteria bacterium]|nr:peptidoglycan editing factor PgeF [Pseudomonadota bacterium]
MEQRFAASLLPADWDAPSSVRAFTTLRGPAGESQPPFDHLNLGIRGGDDPATVLANRDALWLHLRLPAKPRWLQQVHGAGVLRFPSGTSLPQTAPSLSPQAKGRVGEGCSEPQADAAVTDIPGVVLTILTADCLPVLFCDDDGREVAAAHAGWRGLAVGVLENTVAAMQSEPSRLRAWLGPAAGPQAYEVGEEVRAAFVDADPEAAAAFVATRPGHWLCDLYALARLRLAHAGITRVHGGGLCTITDAQRFFSHRRDGRSGRMASLIWVSGRA